MFMAYAPQNLVIYHDKPWNLCKKKGTKTFSATTSIVSPDKKLQDVQMTAFITLFEFYQDPLNGIFLTPNFEKTCRHKKKSQVGLREKKIV